MTDGSNKISKPPTARGVLATLIGINVALLGAAWACVDHRVLLGAILLASAANVAAALHLALVSSQRSLRVAGLIGCAIGILSVILAGLYLSGNWDYLAGRAHMDKGDYAAAVDCYERALESADLEGLVLVNAPLRLRMTSKGIVQDRRVEMYSDLGWIAYSTGDLALARGWYSLAMAVAKNEAYDDAVIRELEMSLARIEGIE
ncbi:tetratricopeptide repeat protein [Coriobacteriia bacterium Es71-Z0120]|uniref:tetratricopeptide repeat protein n=1 Tax=Parvivirga hydrogeniphila TaxID=2939460 RepID=UPI0019BAB233|nr:tetratricopeptide repeat protein [Parvivirga hydrogeniphila]MBC7266883.1 hypothetical protein [Coriobacteriia bacterium]MCL4079271.1 tetratricopeptide repeat protein [Parvivirga hydrogeniphila]